MTEEEAIGLGIAIIILIVMYFIIKWAVKNGIKEAYRDITGIGKGIEDDGEQNEDSSNG